MKKTYDLGNCPTCGFPCKITHPKRCNGIFIYEPLEIHKLLDFHTKPTKAMIKYGKKLHKKYFNSKKKS